MQTNLAEQYKDDEIPEEEMIEQEQESKEQEREELKFKIDTMADFLRALEWSHSKTEDNDLKNKIGHQIVKINIGLSATNYTADKVKVEDMEDGTYGKYYPNSRQTAASKEMLEDFKTSSGLIKHVLVHEEEHGEGYWDESMAEKKALQRLGGTTINFYVADRQKADRAFFNIPGSKELKLYNIKKPEELTDCYLQVELEKKYKSDREKLRSMQRPAYFKIRTEKETASLSQKLYQGVPRLYDRLESSYIKNKIKEILKKLSGEK